MNIKHQIQRPLSLSLVLEFITYYIDYITSYHICYGYYILLSYVHMCYIQIHIHL